MADNLMHPDSPDLRFDADFIFRAALEAVDPKKAVRAHFSLDGDVLQCQGRLFYLSHYEKIVVIGAGKAGAPMALAVEEILGHMISCGIVVVKDGHVMPLSKIKLLEASHPVPDERSVNAARQIMGLVEENAGPSTLFVNLLSGGASALLAAPAPGITLEHKQEVTRLLLECGADIQEINAVRKHLSAVKGGNLARLAAGATIISLVISDVIHDRLDTIGSGPAFPDSTTWEDVKAILSRYDLWERVPNAVRARVEQGLSGELPDTPSADDPCFKGVTTSIIASNRQALSAAAAAAKDRGYTPLVLSSSIQGETSDIARMHGAIAREVTETANPLPPPCCIISGGETTVTMEDRHGKGGRNQEFALAAALEIDGLENVLVLSAGTDGTDGPTDAAGAAVTGKSVELAKKMGLDAEDFLKRHDAYNFFIKTGELIMTGPTLTNVMDVHLMLIV